MNVGIFLTEAEVNSLQGMYHRLSTERLPLYYIAGCYYESNYCVHPTRTLKHPFRRGIESVFYNFYYVAIVALHCYPEFELFRHKSQNTEVVA